MPHAITTTSASNKSFGAMAVSFGFVGRESLAEQARFVESRQTTSSPAHQ
jgi:hypothetical protein